jgi:acetylornithine deacetylase/succinyl-diaminopimelate desuccinylase-like protein
MAPTIMRAGTKINVIPDRVELEVDIRSLPGWDTADVRAMLDEVIGDLIDDVEIEFGLREPSRPRHPSTRRCGMRWNG